jgi:predicted RNA binding protein with dsRBD fold (UPF0201 family)
MNVKLKRVIEEINKTEKKISEWQEQLKQLKQQRKQLEDQEIIKAIRSMQMEGMDMLHLLDGIQDGSVIFVSDDDGEMHMEQEGGQKEGAEREDYEYEE